MEPVPLRALRAQAALNGMPLHVYHVPPSWDGASYKDRNLDQPLVLPGGSLRPGHNALTLTGCDRRRLTGHVTHDTCEHEHEHEHDNMTHVHVHVHVHVHTYTYTYTCSSTLVV